MKKTTKKYIKILDGRTIIGISNKALSIHTLAPYPGWGTIWTACRSILKTYLKHLNKNVAESIGIRYIDLIKIPDKDQPLETYFTCIPPKPKPAAMPNSLSGFQFIIQAIDRDKNYNAVLILSSKIEGKESNYNIIYDLHLTRKIPKTSPNEDIIYTHLTFLHDQQKMIFEDSITSQLRETFQ